MLRDVLDRLYVEKTRENLQEISTLLRQKFGQDLMSKVIAKDVENDPNNIVAVEGIRRPSDIVYLEKADGFRLVYITAEPKIRWQRLVERNENPGDAQKTFEQFLNDQQAEADRMIQELGKTAPIKIDNNGTVGELYNKIENLLKEIKEGL